MTTTTRDLARGVAAGLAGTAAMTAWQELAAALRHAAPMDVDDRFRPERDPWESAPAPAQVARRFLGLAGIDVPASRIGLFTNAVHWGYGTALGAAYGLALGSRAPRPLLRGVAFGSGVWATSYATLVPLGLYEPPWRYRPATIAKDVSYHLVYGAGVAAAHAALVRPSAQT
jgi:hypothetical protein